MITDDFDDELNDLRMEAKARRLHENALMRNPDCRDPDHPGCEFCEENEDE